MKTKLLVLLSLFFTITAFRAEAQNVPVMVHNPDSLEEYDLELWDTTTGLRVWFGDIPVSPSIETIGSVPQGNYEVRCWDTNYAPKPYPTYFWIRNPVNYMPIAYEEQEMYYRAGIVFYNVTIGSNGLLFTLNK